MTGLNGTPMPSFADNLKPEETWDLVDFFLSLAISPSGNRIGTVSLRSHRLNGLASLSPHRCGSTPDPAPVALSVPS